MILDTSMPGLLSANLIEIESEIKRLELQDDMTLRMAFAYFFNHVTEEHPRSSLSRLHAMAVGEELRFVKLAAVLAEPDAHDPKPEFHLWCRQFSGMTFMFEWNHHVKLNAILRLIHKDNRPTINSQQAQSAAMVAFRTHLSLKNMTLEQLKELDIQDHCTKIQRHIRNKYRTD